MVKNPQKSAIWHAWCSLGMWNGWRNLHTNQQEGKKLKKSKNPSTSKYVHFMLRNSLWTNLQQDLLHTWHLLPELRAVHGRIRREFSLCSFLSPQCLSTSAANWQPLHRQMPTSKQVEKNLCISQMFPNSNLNRLLSTKALCAEEKNTCLCSQNF